MLKVIFQQKRLTLVSSIIRWKALPNIFTLLRTAYISPSSRISRNAFRVLQAKKSRSYSPKLYSLHSVFMRTTLCLSKPRRSRVINGWRSPGRPYLNPRLPIVNAFRDLAFTVQHCSAWGHRAQNRYRVEDSQPTDGAATLLMPIWCRICGSQKQKLLNLIFLTAHWQACTRNLNNCNCSTMMHIYLLTTLNKIVLRTCNFMSQVCSHSLSAHYCQMA